MLPFVGGNVFQPREAFRLQDGVGPVDVLGYDHKEFSKQFAVDTGEETLVQQHFREEVDILTIVRRHGLTPNMPSGIAGGVYGDFTGITDFRDAVDRIQRARDGFMALPADVRDRFNNDPGELIELAHSLPEDEFLSAAGLVKPPVVEAPPVPPEAAKPPVPPAGGVG